MSAINQGKPRGAHPGFSQGNAQENKPVLVYRLTQEQYKQLESKVLPPGQVREDTTAIQAGVRIGVELVLRALREGFTA